MPHCVIECSNNVVEGLEYRRLLRQVHAFLGETGLFRAGDIKSRIVAHDRFLVGTGASDRGFAALTLHILEGREERVKQDLAKGIHRILDRHVREQHAELRLSVTVQISELQRCCYVRSTGNG